MQRFRIITAKEAADVGPVPIDSVASPPDTQYVPTTWGRDTVNTALDRWYRYGFLTHLLRSKRHVYVIYDAGGGWAKFRLLSYYCPGPEGGCITIEYGYRGSGAAVAAGVAEPR